MPVGYVLFYTVCAATIAYCSPYICHLIQNNLPDKSIIQLYSKSTQSYLCIKKSGAVKESVNEKLSKKLCSYVYIPHTNVVYNNAIIQYLFTAYLLYRDRGMGIVSLDAYQRPGYRLRMFNNVLQGKVRNCAR